MNPANFDKHRGRIEHIPGRSLAWRKRALKRLIADAGVVELKTGKRVTAYRLPCQTVICVKRRYPNEQSAIDALAQIGNEHDGRIKPIRAYPCYRCFGWHLTSAKHDPQ